MFLGFACFEIGIIIHNLHVFSKYSTVSSSFYIILYYSVEEHVMFPVSAHTFLSISLSFFFLLKRTVHVSGVVSCTEKEITRMLPQFGTTYLLYKVSTLLH